MDEGGAPDDLEEGWVVDSVQWTPAGCKSKNFEILL